MNTQHRMSGRDSSERGWRNQRVLRPECFIGGDADVPQQERTVPGWSNPHDARLRGGRKWFDTTINYSSDRACCLATFVSLFTGLEKLTCFSDIHLLADSFPVSRVERAVEFSQQVDQL